MRVAHLQMTSLSADQLPQLNNIFDRLVHAINNIEFGSVDNGMENVWCALIVTDNTLDAEECASASHGLNRVPVGTIPIWQDKKAIFWKPTDATSADTASAVFYICDTAAVSAVLLLI